VTFMRCAHALVRLHVRWRGSGRHGELSATLIQESSPTAPSLPALLLGQLREDMDKGVFDRFRSLPIARIAPLQADDGRPHRYALAASLSSHGHHHGLPPAAACPAHRRCAPGHGHRWSLAWIFMYIGTIAKSSQSVQSLSIMVLLH